jgi:restriction endonuclease S subunit
MKSNWQTVRLNECCEFVRGVSFQNGDARTNAEAGFIPLLRAGNIANNLDLENDLIWVPERLTAHEQKLQKGDIAICLSSGSPQVVGKTAQLKQDWTGTVGAFCGIVRPGKGVDSEFIGHWFRSPHFINWRNAKARGANIQNLRFQELAELDILLPSKKDEQRRIAARLREQMAEVERSRATVEAQLDAAQSLPAALLRAIFTSPAAQRWPRRRLGDVLETRNDIIHPRNKPTGTATFVGLEHIEPNTGRRIGSIEIDKAVMTGRKAQFFKGDIVYGYLRPYLNKVWIAEFDGLCSVDQYVYQVNNELAVTPFVAWFMRSSTYLERAPIGGSPGQLPRIRMEEVAATEINLPPIAEQQKIAARLDAELTAARSLVETLETRLAEIELLPATLLRSAFSQQN